MSSLTSLIIFTSRLLRSSSYVSTVSLTLCSVTEELRSLGGAVLLCFLVFLGLLCEGPSVWIQLSQLHLGNLLGEKSTLGLIPNPV